MRKPRPLLFTAVRLSLLLVCAGFIFTLAPLHAGDGFAAGVDANYSLGMEREGASWRWDGEAEDLFRGMAEKGVRKFRVRLWTKDEGPNGKNYATEVVERAKAAGMEPYLVIFLSDDWADLMKQPVPASWKDLDLEQRVEAVRVYSRDTVRHFRAKGLESHLYEIGNEIDYGICGVYPGKSAKKSPENLARGYWPDAARLIRASQEGVREADPEAKFLLHISHWWDQEFCVAFFEFMLSQNVQVDFAGLSYFPSSNIGGSLELEEFGAVVRSLWSRINRPIIVPETAYPSTSDFRGQFSRWKKVVPGYPLTPDGQRQWLDDFLDFCAAEPAIDSVYYWSPEWCGEGMWKGFALFDPTGRSRPAWTAFAPSRRDTPKKPVYAELEGTALRIVPVDEARRQARHLLAKKRAEFGRVNVDYIEAITAAELQVDDYAVLLRASLMGNLQLLPARTGATESKPVDPQRFLAGLDPKLEQLGLFTRAESAETRKSLLAAARKNGVKILVHPVADDQPLLFGLGHE